MSLLKVTRDQVKKLLLPKDYVPEGVLEWIRYCRDNDPILFQNENKDGYIFATSTNFRFGSIVTSGKNLKELDKNIRDAILTAFDIPSSFESKADIRREGDKIAEYVAA